MGRIAARRHAFIISFQSEFFKEQDLETTISNYLDDLKTLTTQDYDFIKDEVVGVFDNKESIDRLISKYSVDWEIDRLARIDKNILRITIYELLYAKIHVGIAINEAVELARVFSTDEAPSFINGILSSIVKNEMEISNL